jgi:hypothetical protein
MKVSGQIQLLLLLFVTLTFAGAGCSTRLSRFDVVNRSAKEKDKKPDALEISRSETADQGSGSGSSVSGTQGYSLTRTTVGGAYARRLQVSDASSKYVISGGLHANPRATQ